MQLQLQLDTQQERLLRMRFLNETPVEFQFRFVVLVVVRLVPGQTVAVGFGLAHGFQ